MQTALQPDRSNDAFTEAELCAMMEKDHPDHAGVGLRRTIEILLKRCPEKTVEAIENLIVSGSAGRTAHHLLAHHLMRLGEITRAERHFRDLHATSTSKARGGDLCTLIRCILSHPEPFRKQIMDGDPETDSCHLSVLQRLSLCAQLAARRHENDHTFDPSPFLARFNEALNRSVLLALISFKSETSFQNESEARRNRAFLNLTSHTLKANAVAIVGSGPSLKEFKAGDAIDKHDVVIRLNFPNLQRMKEHTGDRTDIVVFSGRQISKEGGSAWLKTQLQNAPHLQCIYMGKLPPETSSTLGTDIERVHELPSNILGIMKDVCYPLMTSGLFAQVLFGVILKAPCRAFGFDLFEGADFRHIYDRYVVPPLYHELAFERWYARGFIPRINPLIVTRAESEAPPQVETGKST
ncbi:glycosyltransferase family 29 protein [Pararoseomonas baculiformis]|nr:glycosyltransferase family 29 protein [Pararoseomonas baculiformis]